MIEGFESFRNWFKGYGEHYTIIGGTACDLLMSEEALDFRATRDIDLVLIVEALTPEFGKYFWKYILNAGYKQRKKSNGTPQFYRFDSPKSSDYPFMIELFSPRLSVIELPEDAVLTPLPIDDDVSSLSAILLDDAYYKFLLSGKIMLNDVTILDAGYLIPFKAKAWIDLSNKKREGKSVDSRNIRKHKNDIFRLSNLMSADERISVPKSILEDIMFFIDAMKNEDIDLKQIGIANRDKGNILDAFKRIYILE